MKQGDLDAWRSLYARYLPIVWRTVLAKVSDMHAAEDILSETMFGFFSAVDGMKTDCKIAAWLRSVAKNKIGDYYRKQGKQDRLIRGVAETQVDSQFDVDRLSTDETRANIVRILDRLTENERLALEWKYVDGVAVKTIAERLGLTAKATESLLYRGRRAFRKWFEEFEETLDANRSVNERSDRTLKP